MEEAGTQVQTWNKIDMQTKKKELEKMLRGVQWDPLHKKESSVVVPPPAQPPPPGLRSKHFSIFLSNNFCIIR